VTASRVRAVTVCLPQSIHWWSNQSGSRALLNAPCPTGGYFPPKRQAQPSPPDVFRRRLLPVASQRGRHTLS